MGLWYSVSMRAKRYNALNATDKTDKELRQMINVLILATFAFAAVYMTAAFIHHTAASICRRYRTAISQTVSEVVEAIATVTEETTPAIELPNSIRGLREFVRAENLQGAIKSITGKSVSNLNKGELLEAVEMAIA